MEALWDDMVGDFLDEVEGFQSPASTSSQTTTSAGPLSSSSSSPPSSSTPRTTPQPFLFCTLCCGACGVCGVCVCVVSGYLYMLHLATYIIHAGVYLFLIYDFFAIQ